MHGCAKLKNDQGICTLVERAATGWLAEPGQQEQQCHFDYPHPLLDAPTLE